MMKWWGLLIAVIAGSYLSKILYTAQKQAEANGKPRCVWIHVFFWVAWSFTFVLYLCILGLLVWAGFSMYTKGDLGGAVKLLVVAFLLAPCVYLLFISPLIKKMKNKC